MMVDIDVVSKVNNKVAKIFDLLPRLSEKRKAEDLK
jgi:hypothetical protein